KKQTSKTESVQRSGQKEQARRNCYDRRGKAINFLDKTESMKYSKEGYLGKMAMPKTAGAVFTA
ncbi:MAG TPA: hypothetical protein DCZ40_12680, partial [Lachnospiraceae bacterium]|nr:hypothetical protein [Lachnospiraceae bacterium]